MHLWGDKASEKHGGQGGQHYYRSISNTNQRAAGYVERTITGGWTEPLSFTETAALERDQKSCVPSV